jgi:hypothetical protein
VQAADNNVTNKEQIVRLHRAQTSASASANVSASASASAQNAAQSQVTKHRLNIEMRKRR